MGQDTERTPREGSERIDVGPTHYGPRMRAWAPHDVMRRIEDFRPGASRTLRSKVSPVALEALGRTGRFEWISVKHGRELSAAALEVLGNEDFERFFRWMLPAQLDRPMLRGLVRAGVSVFGLTPHTFLRLAATSWKLAFIEVGTPSLEDAALRSSTLVLHDVAEDALVEPAYLRAFAASFSGFFDVCGVQGTVDLSVDRAARSARFRFEW